MTIHTTAVFNPVFTGSVPNDGTGDSLLDAFTKVNGNFSNIASVGFTAANLSVSGSLEVGGVTYMNATTQSTSVVSGAVIVAGGMGIAKDIYVGGNLNIMGNTTYVNTEIVNVEETVIGNSTVRGTLFLGNTVAYPPITYSNPLLVATTSTDSYTQIAIQNLSNGTNASSDFVATADNGTDATRFIDMGINGSGYNSATWTVSGANDGYLYVNQGNLTLGTDTVGKTVKIHTGGTLAANVVATFNAANTAATSTTTGALVVTGGIASNDGIYGANLVINGWGNIGNIQAVQVGNVGTIHTGTTYFGVGTATFGNVQAVQLGNVTATVTAQNINAVGTATIGAVASPLIGNLNATLYGTTANVTGTATIGAVASSLIGNLNATLYGTTANVTGTLTAGNVQAVQLGNVTATVTAQTINAVGTATVGNVQAVQVGNLNTSVTGILGNITPNPGRFTWLSTNSLTDAITNNGTHGRGDIGNATVAYGNLYANAVNLSSTLGGYPSLRLTPGTLTGTAVVGSVENDGNVFYTTTYSGRGAVQPKWSYVLSANINISTSNASPVTAVYYSLLNGAQPTGETPLGFQANVGTYEVDGFFGMVTGVSPHYINFGWGAGTATFTGEYEVQFGNVLAIGSGGSGPSTAASGNMYSQFFWNQPLGGVLGPSAAPLATPAKFIRVKGLLRVTVAGKLVPTVYFTNSPGASTYTLANSYFSVQPLGSAVMTTIGTWN